MDINNQILFYFFIKISLLFISIYLLFVSQIIKSKNPTINFSIPSSIFSNFIIISHKFYSQQKNNNNFLQKSIAFIQIQMNPNTYSLRSILQSDLDPAICKLMLHEIKSPLLEHSFQLTTDDQDGGQGQERAERQQGQYRQGYENGNKFRKQGYFMQNGIQGNRKNYSMYDNRRRHNYYDTMSVTEQQFTNPKTKQGPIGTKQQNLINRSTSTNNVRKIQQNNTKQQSHSYSYSQGPHYIPNHAHYHQSGNTSLLSNKNKLISQFVSPLQCNQGFILENNIENDKEVYQGKEKGKVKDGENFINLFGDQSSLDKYKPPSEKNQNKNNQVAKWCGQVFNFQNAFQNEIFFEKTHTRKKIFSKKLPVPHPLTQPLSPSSSPPQQPFSPNSVSFSQSIQKLLQISQPQLAIFLQFVYKSLSLLSTLAPYKQSLFHQESNINKFLLKYNPIDHQFKQTIANKGRIISRFRCRKISEVLGKIFQKGELKEAKAQQYGGGKGEEALEENLIKILQIYGEIEDVIEDYVSREQTVTSLHKIYNLIYDSEIQWLMKNNKKIQQSRQKNLQTSNDLPSPISTLKSWHPNQQQNPKLKKAPAQKQNTTILSAIPIPLSLKDKFQKFLASLKISSFELKNIQELSYIWGQFSVIGAYSPTTSYNYKLNKQKFIVQLCRNDVITHGRTQGIMELEIQKKLREKGFTRNMQ